MRFALIVALCASLAGCGGGPASRAEIDEADVAVAQAKATIQPVDCAKERCR